MNTSATGATIPTFTATATASANSACYVQVELLTSEANCFDINSVAAISAISGSTSSAGSSLDLTSDIKRQ